MFLIMPSTRIAENSSALLNKMATRAVFKRYFQKVNPP